MLEFNNSWKVLLQPGQATTYLLVIKTYLFD
jgi:hypothetical protein